MTVVFSDDDNDDGDDKLDRHTMKLIIVALVGVEPIDRFWAAHIWGCRL